MPGEGVEPSRAEAHGFLRPARLPVPPSRPGTALRVPAAWLASLAFVACVFTACSHPPVRVATPKVAFFQNLSIDDHEELVSPSYFGLQIGLTEEGQGPIFAVDQLDTGPNQSGATDLARRIASDPSYVAVVLAPFVQETPQIAQIFADSGLAVLSLSPDSQSGDAGAVWRQLVRGQDDQALRLANVLQARGAGGVCLGSATDRYSASLAASVRADLPKDPATAFQIPGTSIDDAIKLIKFSGCSVVGWIGFPSAAATLRTALSAAGMAGTPMVGADSMKTISYIQEPGRDGTFVTCPCADVTTSSKLPAQQLVHDYQVETGLEPGVYAAEGWDAAGMLLQAVRGAATRDQVRSALAGLTSYAGAARDYSFAPGGSLETASSTGVFVSTGVRWIQVGG